MHKRHCLLATRILTRAAQLVAELSVFHQFLDLLLRVWSSARLNVHRFMHSVTAQSVGQPK